LLSNTQEKKLARNIREEEEVGYKCQKKKLARNVIEVVREDGRRQRIKSDL